MCFPLSFYAKHIIDNKRILDDLHLQVKELEEKRAKIQPIINLVDNMVKLGSLYRGPSDAPLSHRIRNLPSASSNANVNSKSNTNTTPNPVPQELKDEIQVSENFKKKIRNRKSISYVIQRVLENVVTMGAF